VPSFALSNGLVIENFYRQVPACPSFLHLGF
jgi:hypothetical protein